MTHEGQQDRHEEGHHHREQHGHGALREGSLLGRRRLVHDLDQGALLGLVGLGHLVLAGHDLVEGLVVLHVTLAVGELQALLGHLVLGDHHAAGGPAAALQLAELCPESRELVLDALVVGVVLGGEAPHAGELDLLGGDGGLQGRDLA